MSARATEEISAKVGEITASTAPAAVRVCPIIDLTEPITARVSKVATPSSTTCTEKSGRLTQTWRATRSWPLSQRIRSSAISSARLRGPTRRLSILTVRGPATPSGPSPALA